MPMIEWSDKLAVNIREIDNQHRKLVEMVNTLHAAMVSGTAASVTDTMVVDMKRYALTHFATEERIMKQNGYPEYLAHKAEHDAFVKQVTEIEAGSRAGTSIVSIDILRFLSKWMLHHIVGTDKKYVPHLKGHGVN